MVLLNIIETIIIKSILAYIEQLFLLYLGITEPCSVLLKENRINFLYLKWNMLP